MRRLSNEDGVSAAHRNWGRLALALIPAAIGIAAILWIAAAFDWISLGRQRRIDQRTREIVGVETSPAKPVALVNNNGACLKIDKSFMDGREIVFYARNTCQRWLEMPNYAYRVMAHDGTVIESARWAFSGDRAFAPGERREVKTRVANDDRLERVELWVID